MDAQLQQLIDKIKADGVARAQAEAEALKAQARQDAEQVVAQARAQADQLLAQAQAEIARREAASRDALKQASRDLVLALEQRLIALFRAATREGVDAALTPELVQKVVVDLAKAWGENAALEVTLGSADAEKLGAALRTALAKKVKSVEVVASTRFAKGIRVAGSGEALTLDLSSGALADLLADALQPTLAAVLREAVQ